MTSEVNTMSSERASFTSLSTAGDRSTLCTVASAPKLVMAASIFSEDALQSRSKRSAAR